MTYPRDILRTHLLELNIRLYGDVLIMYAGDILKTLVGDVLRTFVGNVPWRYIENHMGTSVGCNFAKWVE